MNKYHKIQVTEVIKLCIYYSVHLWPSFLNLVLRAYMHVPTSSCILDRWSSFLSPTMDSNHVFFFFDCSTVTFETLGKEWTIFLLPSYLHMEGIYQNITELIGLTISRKWKEERRLNSWKTTSRNIDILILHNQWAKCMTLLLKHVVNLLSLLFNWTANGVLSRRSCTTKRHNTQIYTYHTK
jgi:hypothetical protein